MPHHRRPPTRLRRALRRVAALLAVRHTPARAVRPRNGKPAPDRALHIVGRTPAALGPVCARLRRPAAQAPRSTARQPALFGGVLFEEASPVRPYVLPPAERARMLRGGAR
ncbi:MULTISPECIES: hypothetical protein [Streptomyces]|uniref:hypothetical protein n=1 Tax=Streptomyces TaxID=1883 RepID=UPI002F41BC98